MTARPQTAPVKLRPKFDFCLVIFRAIHPDDGNGSWVEVKCVEHEWQCGHRHRHWGPTTRCASRHQLEVRE